MLSGVSSPDRLSGYRKMSVISFLFVVAAAIALLTVSRSWASLPLLAAAMYIPVGQEIEIIVFHFSVIRLLVVVGFLRVLMKGERPAGGMQPLDRAMYCWGVGLLVSGVFHTDPGSAIVLRLGMAYECAGLYFLFRVFIHSFEDFQRVLRIICVLMVPVAVVMLVEMVKGHNFFADIFGGPTDVDFRNGKYRARGPFVHAILAGTIGAACFPMATLLWRKERKLALAGTAAALGIVFASKSSGPMMTTITILGALLCWKHRDLLPMVRWAAALVIVALHFIMTDPVWFLMARIDITGGSTGWHRAQLISSAVEHLKEWWLIGTDYTRHWMPTGIYANTNHTDITNHYLTMGVIGGLPLMLLFIWVLTAAFSAVGQALRAWHPQATEMRYAMWTLGAIMFGHATTFMSISYFGQALAFLYLQLACIGSLRTFQPVMTAVSARRTPDLVDASGQANGNFAGGSVA